MSHRISYLFVIFAGILLFTQTLFAVETLKAPSTNIQFPSEITENIDGEDVAFHATGVATRSKFFANVYSMAHYMRHPVQGKRNIVFEEILTDNQPKQVVINWVRDVDLKRMRDGFKNSMQQALRYNPANVQSEIDQFLAMFDQSIKSGDVYTIRWLPGGLVDVEVNGELVGTIENPDFAKTLWSVWFGKKSVVSRNRLISLVKAN